MLFADVTSNIIQILSPLFLAALAWVATRLARLITARVQSEHARDVVKRLDSIVLAAVREVQQVLVDDAKEASPNGRLAPDMRLHVRNVALATVRAELGPSGLAELVRVLGPDSGHVDNILVTRIEAAVHDLRRLAPPVKNGVNHGPLLAGT